MAAQLRILNQLAAAAVVLPVLGLTVPSFPQSGKGPTQPGMTLSTSAFTDGGVIPDRFTVSAAHPVSPPLQWTNVPANTVSFVLILHDPDGAPQKKVEDWLHWLAFNIPATARELPEGVPSSERLPDGTIQALNRGINGYLGPGAPAAGPYHHYTFELFALDIKLDLGPDATRGDVLKVIDGHILAKAALVGRFHR